MDIKHEIERIAFLARLDPNEKGFSQMETDFSNIISMMDKLETLDLTGVTDEVSTEFVNAFRDDTPVQEYTREELLKNAPVSEAGCIAVPSVME